MVGTLRYGVQNTRAVRDPSVFGLTQILGRFCETP
jgi:hypothetical protein